MYFFRCENVLDNTKGLYEELRDNYYKYPAQLLPLTWLSDKIPAAPAEIRVEKVDNELKLSWQKPAAEQEDLTYTIYYSLTDSIDTASAKSILATGVRDTVLYLPVAPNEERGYTFSVSASTRYHIESAVSPETYYYLSRFLK